MLLTHGINLPYSKMTKNRSGPPVHDSPPLRATAATVQMTPADGSLRADGAHDGADAWVRQGLARVNKT